MQFAQRARFDRCNYLARASFASPFSRGFGDQAHVLKALSHTCCFFGSATLCFLKNRAQILLGRSVSEITAISLVLPLLGLLWYLALRTCTDGSMCFRPFWLTWATAEIIFYAVQRRRYHFHNSVSVHPPLPPCCLAELQSNLSHCLVNCNKHWGVSHWLAGWFNSADIGVLHRGNVEEYFAAICFDCRMCELPKQYQAVAHHMVDSVEALCQEQNICQSPGDTHAVPSRSPKAGFAFPPGHNPHITFMAHRWEPLRVLHRPLLLYLVTEMMALITTTVFWSLGFTWGRHNGMNYWVRKPASTRDGCSPRVAHPKPAKTRRRKHGKRGVQVRNDSAYDMSGILASHAHAPCNTHHQDSAQRQRFSTSPGPPSTDTSQPLRRSPEPLPIVFLHGISFGLLPYIPFLVKALLACPEAPFVVFEVAQVSGRFCWNALDFDQVADTVSDVLRLHGYHRACLLAHSYGTFVASRICKVQPKMVDSMMLIDPVCLLTCYPTLLSNFIYKLPGLRQLTSIIGWADIARFFLSRDPMVATTLCRKFMWHQLQLWSHEVPQNTRLVFSEMDTLIPIQMVLGDLQHHGFSGTVLCLPNGFHGSVIMNSKWQSQLVVQLAQMVASS